MARTVIGSGTKFLPEVSTIAILTDTTKGAGTLNPTLAYLTDASALEVTAAVANVQNFGTGRNMVSDSTWGAQSLPFTVMGGSTLDGTPTIEFWADRGGDDIQSELTADDTVSIVLGPSGLDAADVVRIWAGSVASVSPVWEKGSITRIRVQFAIQDIDDQYTVPGT